MISDIVSSYLWIDPAIAYILDFTASFAVIALLFAVIYKFVPTARVAWKDVWLGAD